jgi:hypothetical protein
MNSEDTMTRIDPREPTLGPDFAQRVVQRVRAERKHRRDRRRVAIAGAFAITGVLVFHLIASNPGPAKYQPPDESAAAVQWSESLAEQAGWPLGWNSASAQDVGGYFFPDLGSLATFSSEYQSDAPSSLDSVLGFDDQGSV